MYAEGITYTHEIYNIRPSITVCRPTKGFAIITCHRCLLLLETLSPFVRRTTWAECLCVVSLRAAYILSYVYTYGVKLWCREIRLGLFLPKRTCFRVVVMDSSFIYIYIHISYTLYTPHCTRIINPLKRPKHILYVFYGVRGLYYIPSKIVVCRAIRFCT